MSGHPLAVDMVELVDELPAEKRETLAHIAVCEPCRRGLINIIQTNPEYPDLFARYPDRDLCAPDEVNEGQMFPPLMPPDNTSPAGWFVASAPDEVNEVDK